MSTVQRRAIVTVLNAHRQDLDVTSLTSDLKDMGILTTEQCQQLASLHDKGRRHEALLYTLLAHDGPDIYDKLVECVKLRDNSIAADLKGVCFCSMQCCCKTANCSAQHITHTIFSCAATFEVLLVSPGTLSDISGSGGVYTSVSLPRRAYNHIIIVHIHCTQGCYTPFGRLNTKSFQLHAYVSN